MFILVGGFTIKVEKAEASIILSQTTDSSSFLNTNGNSVYQTLGTGLSGYVESISFETSIISTVAP